MAGVVKIKNVYMDLRVINGKPDISLDIHLDNGQIIIYSVDADENDPRFLIFLEEDYQEQPKTDGSRIYWRDGPSIHIDDIMASLKKSKYQVNGFNYWKTILLVFAATAAVLVLTIFNYPNFFGQENYVSLEPERVPLAAPDFSEYVEYPEIISMYYSDGAVYADPPLHNPEGNDCYFVFEIVYNCERIFISDKIVPGDSIDMITPDRQLDEDDREVLLNINAYSLESLAAIGCANMTFVLDVF